jgi:DNA-directed RNA polymerase subunit M/transcription elongation factor TFIIS
MSTWSIRTDDLKKKQIEAVARFRKNRKRVLLEYAGGMKCVKCGYDKDIPDVYEFHHVNPTEKDPSWGKMIANNHKVETMKAEIEKCIILCANCHRETHWILKQEKIKEDFTK